MHILFVVTCSFPLGEASSIRAINLARMIVAAGYSLYIIADSKGTDCNDVPCEYECVADKAKSFSQRNSIAKESVKRIKNYCDNHPVDAILMNARYDRFDSVLNFCKKKKIPLYIESCEWYHYGNFKLKFLDYRFWLNQKMIMLGFRRIDGFISISRLLDEHNKRWGGKSVRVPTIMDVDQIVYRTKAIKRDKIEFVYSGNPGVSKELLAPMISILANNREIKEKVVFHIYGVNRSQVLKNKKVNVQMLRSAGDSLIIHGRVSQEEIGSIVMNADFQLFIRPDRKSSNAGFPTKLGESMAVGTPVISNLTGDIGLYLNDGYNGYIVEGNTPQELERTITNILSLNQEEYESLRNNARMTAEQYFDYHKYIDYIANLFGGLNT